MGTRTRTLLSTLGVALLIAVVLAGAYVVIRGYPGEFRNRLGEQGPPAPVVDLHSIDQLRTAFDQDAGTARLLVLFSPT